MTRLVADGLGDVLDTHAQHIWKHKRWLIVVIRSCINPNICYATTTATTNDASDSGGDQYPRSIDGVARTGPRDQTLARQLCCDVNVERREVLSYARPDQLYALLCIFSRFPRKMRLQVCYAA